MCDCPRWRKPLQLMNQLNFICRGFDIHDHVTRCYYFFKNGGHKTEKMQVLTFGMTKRPEPEDIRAPPHVLCMCHRLTVHICTTRVLSSRANVYVPGGFVSFVAAGSLLSGLQVFKESRDSTPPLIWHTDAAFKRARLERHVAAVATCVSSTRLLAAIIMAFLRQRVEADWVYIPLLKAPKSPLELIG